MTLKKMASCVQPSSKPLSATSTTLPGAPLSAASTTLSSPPVATGEWWQHVQQCNQLRCEMATRTRRAEVKYEWKPGIIACIQDINLVFTPTPNKFDALDEHGVTPISALPMAIDVQLREIRDTRRQTQRMRQEEDMLVKKRRSQQKRHESAQSATSPRAQQEGWLKYDQRLHKEREAAKQRAAKAQRQRIQFIQNIVLQEKLARDAGHAQRQLPSINEGHPKGYCSGENRRQYGKWSCLCSGCGPLCCNQIRVGTCHHAAPTGTGETPIIFLLVHPTALSVAARAPIMHQPSAKLPTPSIKILAPTAPSHRARDHKDKLCLFP